MRDVAGVVGIVLLEVLSPESLAKSVIGLIFSAKPFVNIDPRTGNASDNHRNVIVGLCFASQGISFAVDNGS